MRHSLQRPKLLLLLEAIAAGRHDLSLRAWDAAQIDWIIQSGLGPVCFHTAKGNLENLNSPHWTSLRAADLTARIIAAEHLDAMREIIDAGEDCIPRLTLLKGISMAEEYYPEFHLRPMRDIDILVPEEHLICMDSLLRDLGYKQRYGGLIGGYESHHHLAPFFHEEKNVWIEVHHHLLSTKNRASRDRVFALPNVIAQIRRSAFHGREVYRLGPELELVYLAAHWAQDFKTIGGMIAVMDFIYLLRHTGGKFRWDAIFEWLEGSAAATYLYLLVSYLDHLKLILLPYEILRRLFRLQRSFGKFTRKATHTMMDRYMLDGKDLGLVLTRRNLSIAWNTLVLPLPSPCKLLLFPLNLCVPFQFRIQ
jgi:putative nucleotidyltransferase-like protein